MNLNIGQPVATGAGSILAGLRTPDPISWRDGRRDVGRKTISKRLRFEVFKRDSFKCQYCGKSAPQVVLHVDHIQPVSRGGDADILNLITACIDCNAGKSDRLLDDDSAIAKQRLQLEELNERREQLEMLLEWREGLKEIGDDTVQAVCDEFAVVAPGVHLNDTGIKSVRRLLREFSLTQILDAVQVAGDRYVKLDAEGNATPDSANLAWTKIGGIARLSAQSEGERKLYYIRGICRNRLEYCVDWKCLSLLKEAFSLDVGIEYMMNLARDARSWTQWQDWMIETIAEAKQARDGASADEGESG